ncbi:hypothetical protein QTP70_005710 [Hemibagrus guttatus]|uniref:Uncharacterized protein n=1 Tax=Hemibagrus guttatus TaxID=175788 RepID=A0AAE0Q8C4_9TELE|nr:hypothetical protein QTP70_005710 [Hemibagrus guttatus]
MGPNSNTKTPETHNLDAQTSSNCFENQRRCYTMATYRPFVKQVLEEIFNPTRPECPDIEHASGGLTDLLKTGFSMFMKVNRPHPSDHPLLFLFMVGGVTASELRLIREVVSTHKTGTQSVVWCYNVEYGVVLQCGFRHHGSEYPAISALVQVSHSSTGGLPSTTKMVKVHKSEVTDFSTI